MRRWVTLLGVLGGLATVAGCDSAEGDPPDPDAQVEPDDVGADADVNVADVPRDVAVADTPHDVPGDAHDTPYGDVGPGEVYQPPDDRPEGWACDLEARVQACEAALLHDGAAPPDDPSDLLYYVNRSSAIPPGYPVSPTSTWNPCQAGDPGVDHDLVCVPNQYTTKANALRQVAWASPAPSTPLATFDAKPVGHQGEVGFRALFEAAQSEVGAILYVASGFRSYAVQDNTYGYYVQQEIAEGYDEHEAALVAGTYSAEPGHSEHQLGTTADLVYQKDNGAISSFGRAHAVEMAASWQMQWVMENAHRFGIVLTYGHDKVATTQYVWEPWHWRFVGVEAANAMRECELNTEEFLATRYGLGPPPPWEGAYLILTDAFSVGSGDAEVTVVEPGQPLSRSFTLTNTGTTNWSGYALRPVGDALGGQPVELPCTPPFAAVELTLDLVAPQASGLHTAEWYLFDASDEPVAGPLLVQLYVSSGDPNGTSPYRFVRLDDMSNVTGGADPGADVDAIVLTKAATGQVHFAEAVTSYLAAPSDVANGDPTAALFAPDAFTGWPDDLSVCKVSGGFVSLGGAGHLIVDMGVDIEEGDTLLVLEVGACSYGSGTAFADPLKVRVSVGSSVETPWIPLGDTPGGPASLPVGPLPPL